MKVGDYVRTKKHGIGKIIGQNCNGWFELDLLNVHSVKKYFPNVSIKNNKYYIIKSSPNIIDLIEVGDYVNGLKITLINEPSMANCNKRLLYAEDEEGYLIKMFSEEDIKLIVTKEQFESMEYKIGE